MTSAPIRRRGASAQIGTVSDEQAAQSTTEQVLLPAERRVSATILEAEEAST
jgi:hypothetical protein